jgi:hypothetical protein
LRKSFFVCVKIWIQRDRWLSDATNYGGGPGGEVIGAEPNAGGLAAARGGEAGCAGVGPAGGEVALNRSGGGGGVGRFIGDAAESALAFSITALKFDSPTSVRKMNPNPSRLISSGTTPCAW